MTLWQDICHRGKKGGEQVQTPTTGPRVTTRSKMFIWGTETNDLITDKLSRRGGFSVCARALIQSTWMNSLVTLKHFTLCCYCLTSHAQNCLYHCCMPAISAVSVRQQVIYDFNALGSDVTTPGKCDFMCYRGVCEWPRGGGIHNTLLLQLGVGMGGLNFCKKSFLLLLSPSWGKMSVSPPSRSTSLQCNASHRIMSL